MGGNLLVILGTDQSLMPATNWHDGQISSLRDSIARRKSRSWDESSLPFC
jgi:hypothetical protein